MDNDLILQGQADRTNPTFVSTSSGSLDRLGYLPFPYDRGTVLVFEVVGEHPVGRGGHSDVWKAKVQSDDQGYFLVALKVLRSTHLGTNHNRNRLEREAGAWGRLFHQNIATFCGVIYQSNGSPVILSQWYENGRADAYLRQHYGSAQVNPMQIISEIAAGIEYLHNMNIVHGDLKGANIVIDDSGHAKLIDFGLSRTIDLDGDPELALTTSTTTTTTTLRWCAPELLRADDAPVTKSSDMYAFASTTLELLTHDVPYCMLSKWDVYQAIIRGIGPRGLSNDLQYDILHVEVLWHILERCWACATVRPDMTEIRDCLRAFYS